MKKPRVPPPKKRPAPNLKLSQFFTPDWLARRMAGWVPRAARVLEPCCGRGDLIRGLLELGHPLELVQAFELDARLMRHTRDRFAASPDNPAFRTGDFLYLSRAMHACFDVVLMNPVYERNLHLAFVLRALELAPVVIALVPSDFVNTQERDARLWATHGKITRRADLPVRVKFVGQGGQNEHVVLQIERRNAVRAAGEVVHIPTEVWRPDDVIVAPPDAATESRESCAA